MSIDNTSSMTSSDSIFRTTIGGASEVATMPGLVKPGEPKFMTYELPIEVEDIGMPVYLAGIIQLITVVILLSKKKTYQASISFFTTGLFMFTVHCAFAGKSDKLGQFNSICRNFSYLMILFPLINVILVLSTDYLKIWKTLKYAPGKLKLQLPHFKLNQEEEEEEEENQIN